MPASMTFEQIFVFIVLAFLILFLYKGYLRSGVTFLVAITALVAAGIITPKEAVGGFANESLGVIVLLLVISNIFQKTGMIDGFFRRMFSKDDGVMGFRFKLMSGVGVFSGILNNTPIVAMLIPYVQKWCKENSQAPSRFLIPLSFASILGGCVTLIGTSTNLIVNGIAVENGAESLGIFDFVPAGLPMLLIGVFFLTFFSDKLLPHTKDPMGELMGRERQYFLETHIEPGSPLIGKTVEEAGLRNLSGVYLVEIMRYERYISPVSPVEVLQEGDVLFFAGITEGISELADGKDGLSLPRACDIPRGEENDIVEVVISQNSNLAGKRVKDTDFRGRYDGAILAIHRNGEEVRGKVGKQVLRPGDVLLVLAGKDFQKRVENDPAFYLLSMAYRVHNIDTWKVALLLGGLLTSIVLAVTGTLPLFIPLSVLLVLTILLGVTDPTEIRNSIDFHLVLVIALGLALGKAMVNSGSAELVANGVIGLAKPFGNIGLLAAIFLITNLLSAFMTSKAAVAIILPIVIPVSQNLGIDSAPFVLTVAYGGAANFITPVGYQTNLMVYGPGGYSFGDFFRIGAPLTAIYLVVSVSILGYWYGLL